MNINEQPTVLKIENAVLMLCMAWILLLIYQLTSYTLLVTRHTQIISSLVEHSQIIQKIQFYSCSALVPMAGIAMTARSRKNKLITLICLLAALSCLLYGFFLSGFIRSLL